MYSILVLICSTALSHAECQAKTAVDVVRGPTVDNPMMCGFNAQTMIAHTEEWVAEVKARRSAIQ
jgi:hypothetical protein